MHDLQAEPTIDVGLGRLIAAGLKDAGGQARLPTGGQAGRVPVAWVTNQWQRAINRADESMLGFTVASRWRFGHLRLTDYMFRSAPTLADAVAGFVRFVDVLNTAANDVGLVRGKRDGLTIVYQVRSGDPQVDAVASQFALGTILRLARHAAGREIRPLHLGFAADAPTHASRIAAITGAREIDYGTELSFMTLPPDDLFLPLPDADATLAAVLETHAADVIKAGGAGATLRDRLRPVIAAQFGTGEPSLAAAAHKMAMSPRSLQRRLSEEGTSWRDVVDALRRERVEALLADGLSRSAVAARVGFNDSRALRAALRRWHGN
ncbi:AraC family transcriptional regulator [Mycobacterium paraterrae]|uniref:AraC family transcriptional regulator n=1 Tax=Mycobacterium paraterrae TaxID=577492 RepID=A0ABY3VJD3_9MYCO|nr:AraC family transcriptional regulator ligand-binding domain-containing protein [Mycobacterium paraterrae]UMB69519.1 AraC family transcriptional regulator [Mycobacterium paraterrae]